MAPRVLSEKVAKWTSGNGAVDISQTVLRLRVTVCRGAPGPTRFALGAIVGAQNGAFDCTPNDPNCTPPTIVGEILQVDLFSAIVATRWHKQNLAQDEFQVEILAMTPLRQSEDIPMSQLLAK